VQTPATPDGSLVMRVGQRFESARRLSFYLQTPKNSNCPKLPIRSLPAVANLTSPLSWSWCYSLSRAFSLRSSTTREGSPRCLPPWWRSPMPPGEPENRWPNPRQADSFLTSPMRYPLNMHSSDLAALQPLPDASEEGCMKDRLFLNLWLRVKG
jgi:hypothetical protein